MNAIPEQKLDAALRVDESLRQPFPNSRKIYVTGSRDDIRVPMREIQLSDTPASRPITAVTKTVALLPLSPQHLPGNP